MAHVLEAIWAHHGPPGHSAVIVLVSAISLRGIMSIVKFRVGRRIRSAATREDCGVFENAYASNGENNTR